MVNLKKIVLDQTINKMHHFKVTYWNARSVCNKTVSLYEYLSNNNCELLILTETWLHKSSPDFDENKVTLSKLLPNGFKIKHCSRSDGRTGGGVAIVFSDQLSAKVQNCFSRNKFKQFEFMSTMINFRNACFCITVVYRPPPSRRNNLKLKCFWKEWSDLLLLHTNSNFDFVIVGMLIYTWIQQPMLTL